MKQILAKIKNLFKSKEGKFDKEVKLSIDEYGDLSASLISFTDASYMTSLGAKMCIGQGVEEDYSKRLAHISRVIGRGHESTAAHSNIIMLLLMDASFCPKFTEISNALHFTEFVTAEQEDGSIAVLIGGSVRAYKYFFREAKDLSNPICIAIKEILYQSAESVFFEDFIEDGIMDKEKFRFYPVADTSVVTEEVTDSKDGQKYDQDFCEAVLKPQNILKGKKCDIIYADDALAILDKVSIYGFTLRDVLKTTICIVIFHDISRIISQQITRHLGGISQESQRYVDYSKSQFIDPLQFNPEKYDVNAKYTVDILGTKYSMTAFDLGCLMQSIYPQLIAQGMLKQDARGFLPNNVNTKLLMTFTLANLIHFDKERKANAAQPEIQDIDNEMIELLYQYEATTYLFTSIGRDNLIDLWETPIYKTKQENEFKVIDESIDEVISEEEEIV